MSEVSELTNPTGELHQGRKRNENPSAEPIKKETIEDICDTMKSLPRQGEAYAYNIPYREKLRESHMVLDDETGLYVEASYQTGDQISRLRASTGLSIVLSTPPFTDDGVRMTSLNKMGEVLKKIYGDSPELDKEVERLRITTSGDTVYDRVKFELFHNDGEEVLNGFSAVSGKERVAIEYWRPPKRQVLENGGQFLHGILERVTKKQIGEAEENKVQVQEVIDKAEDEVVMNDLSNAYQYAYHSTVRSNIPEISELGLQPSGSGSKEPGTIWFTGWDSATIWHPEDEGGEGVLYRFRVKDMPEIAESWHFDEEIGFEGSGMTIATKQPIPPDRLDFSLDRGETWMPNVPKKVKEAAL